MHPDPAVPTGGTAGAVDAADAVDENGLLDGRVRLLQPARGYRVSIDAVLLAAAAAPDPGAVVLDVGSGVGSVALCLLHRRPDLRLVAVEQQATLAALARRNADRNRLAGRLSVLEQSIAPRRQALAAVGRMLPRDRTAAGVDHVVTNPPQHGAGADPSPDPSRALADREAAVPLSAWLGFCVAALRPGGGLTLVHRADRLDEVLAALAAGPRVGAIRVLPLWPMAGRPARRVILSAVKGRRTPMVLLPGLVLHGAAGHFTAEADAVLRDGAALAI